MSHLPLRNPANIVIPNSGLKVISNEWPRDVRAARDVSVRQWTMSRLKVRVRAIQKSRFPEDPRTFLA
jgi:hypothetical protein